MLPALIPLIRPRASTNVTPSPVCYYRTFTSSLCDAGTLSLGISIRFTGKDHGNRLEVLDGKAAADDEINWVTAIFMALFHVGAIAALFFFSWKALLVAMFLWWVSGSLGIGMGYHRLLTHRGYKTPNGLNIS